MSPSHSLSWSSARRGRASRPFVALALLLAAGAVPAVAQQRIEISTRTRAPRAEPGDSTERRVKLLQRQLDSLTQVYNESDDLSAVERRRMAEDIAHTVSRLVEMSARLSEGPDGTPRPGSLLRMGPMMAERAATAMSRGLMQLQEAQQSVGPRGWIGIVAVGPGLDPRIEDGELLVRYLSYPGIVSVDPSSPAQRAGLVPGDTLLAYNGRDVRGNDISLTRLLIPSARVDVRVRRDGHVRDFAVTVAKAPTRIVQRRDDELRDVRTPWVIAGVPDAPAFPRSAAPVAVGALRASMRIPPVPPSQPGPTASATVAPVAPTRPPFVFTFSSGVAGAQLETITEGLGRAIGVSSGVLVIRSPVGSPANESGLVDGDVIVRVAGQSVRTVPEVRELVALAAENGDHLVELEIIRQKKAQKLTLRW